MEIKKITVKGITYDIKDSLPAGGEAGQVLKKASGADYDTEWGNEKSGGDSAVLYTAQTLTDEQKTQARANIGAGTVTDTDLSELSDAFYADLENKQALEMVEMHRNILENMMDAADKKFVNKKDKVASSLRDMGAEVTEHKRRDDESLYMGARLDKGSSVCARPTIPQEQE